MKYAMPAIIATARILVIIAPRMNRMRGTPVARQWQGWGRLWQQLYSHSVHILSLFTFSSWFWAAVWLCSNATPSISPLRLCFLVATITLPSISTLNATLVHILRLSPAAFSAAGWQSPILNFLPFLSPTLPSLGFLVLMTDFFSPVPGCQHVNYNPIQAPRRPPSSLGWKLIQMTRGESCRGAHMGGSLAPRRPKKGSPQFSRRPVWHLGDIPIDPGFRPTVTFGINFVTKNVSPAPSSLDFQI